MFFKKGFVFVLILRSLDCCVYGVFRWVVEEGCFGGVRVLGELRFDCVIFVFSFSFCGFGGSSLVRGFRWGMEFRKGLGKEFFRELMSIV